MEDLELRRQRLAAMCEQAAQQTDAGAVGDLRPHNNEPPPLSNPLKNSAEKARKPTQVPLAHFYPQQPAPYHFNQSRSNQGYGRGVGREFGGRDGGRRFRNGPAGGRDCDRGSSPGGGVGYFAPPGPGGRGKAGPGRSPAGNSQGDGGRGVGSGAGPPGRGQGAGRSASAREQRHHSKVFRRFPVFSPFYLNLGHQYRPHGQGHKTGREEVFDIECPTVLPCAKRKRTQEANPTCK